MAHFMTEIHRLTAPQDEYLEDIAELTGSNTDLNYGNFAKINCQQDVNYDQNKVIIEHTKNFVGFLLAKCRRKSQVDINQMINGMTSIGHQMSFSTKSLVTDLQCGLLRTYPRITARQAYFMILPLFHKVLPPNDEFLKEMIRVLEDEQSALDYRPNYENRIINSEEWIRFLLTLNAT